MQIKHFDFKYELYNNLGELPENDAALLLEAQTALSLAYVPYSNFSVGAAALLENGEIFKSANQENASYPVTICAERVLLSTLASIRPGIAIQTLAISYRDKYGQSNQPISPCGMCRQALLEYEQRFSKVMRIILGGLKGEIYLITGIQNLLPFSFSAHDLG